MAHREIVAITHSEGSIDDSKTSVDPLRGSTRLLVKAFTFQLFSLCVCVCLSTEKAIRAK